MFSNYGQKEVVLMRVADYLYVSLAHVFLYIYVLYILNNILYLILYNIIKYYIIII